MDDKPEIKVFVTKKRQFRARIKENKNSIPYEVTIGGKSWWSGTGRKHEKTIIKRCRIILTVLISRMTDIGESYE